MAVIPARNTMCSEEWWVNTTSPWQVISQGYQFWQPASRMRGTFTVGIFYDRHWETHSSTTLSSTTLASRLIVVARIVLWASRTRRISRARSVIVIRSGLPRSSLGPAANGWPRRSTKITAASQTLSRSPATCVAGKPLRRESVAAGNTTHNSQESISFRMLSFKLLSLVSFIQIILLCYMYCMNVISEGLQNQFLHPYPSCRCLWREIGQSVMFMNTNCKPRRT